MQAADTLALDLCDTLPAIYNATCEYSSTKGRVRELEPNDHVLDPVRSKAYIAIDTIPVAPLAACLGHPLSYGCHRRALSDD